MDGQVTPQKSKCVTESLLPILNWVPAVEFSFIYYTKEALNLLYTQSMVTNSSSSTAPHSLFRGSGYFQPQLL